VRGLTLQTPAIWPRWAIPTITALAVTFALLTPFVHTTGPRSPAVAALLVLAVTPWLLALAGTHLHPVPFAAGVLVPIAVLNLATGALGLSIEHDVQLSLMLLILLASHLGAAVPSNVAVTVGVLAAAIPAGRSLLTVGFDSWVFWSAGILLGLAAGTIGRRQQLLVAELRRAQDALAADAARQERQRIAREVHDVIAHSLTVTMLHLTTARLALRRDVAKAERTLTEAERLGRQALTDVRRAVGLLHDGDTDATGAALPGLEEVDALLDSYRAAGLRLRASITADPIHLSPAASLAVYRAVQESLANAAKHAPDATVEVAVIEEDGEVVVHVRDAGADRGRTTVGTGAGLGLRAMDERVRALGGSVSAGPDGAGWTVTCRVPTGDAS
jgi:signal transduction histidine kinase